MRYLKTFNESLFSVRVEGIQKICHEYGIRNYTINDDMSIDVDGSVFLDDVKINKLPLKFRNVSGFFACNNNNLVSLEGSPKYVGGSFVCSFNKLHKYEVVHSKSPQRFLSLLISVYSSLVMLSGSLETLYLKEE